MFRNLFLNSLYGKRFVAIEHLTNTEGDLLNVLILTKKRNELKVEDAFQTEALESLVNKIPKHQHVFLIINNNKVISKKTERFPETQKSVLNAFPNIKLENFYYDILDLDENSIVNICRKEEVNKLIDAYQKSKINIIGISLGSSIGKQLENLSEYQTICTANRCLLFKNQILNDVQESGVKSNTYNINGLEISNTYILPFSAILSHFRGQTKAISNFMDVIKQLRNNFQQQRIFTFGLKISLATIFALLLLSFIFFTHYSDKINQLNAGLEINKTDKNILLQLTKDVQKKERLVNDISLASSKVSWYLDQIGMTVPGSVLLSGIEYQPVLKTIKENEPVQIEENTVLLSGTSNNGNDFTSWTQQLENEDWVKHVTIEEYGIGKNVNTAFKIELRIN